MYIYYSPCKSDRDTQIEVIDENTLIIDNETYEFDELSITFPSIAEQTENKILEAHREDNVLYVKILRLYNTNCPWDTGNYQLTVAKVEEASV